MGDASNSPPRIDRRYAAGIVVLAILGWYAFLRGVRVPLLGAADFGFHELGHMLFMWAPRPVQALAGSATQMGVPLALAAYFLHRRDSFAGALMLGWAATSTQDASVYIADAPFQRLPLVGGYHDWAYLLGPGALDIMDGAGPLAGTVWVAGFLMLTVAFALCVAGLIRGPIAARHAALESARLAALPVREPGSRSAPPHDEDRGSGPGVG